MTSPKTYEARQPDNSNPTRVRSVVTQEPSEAPTPFEQFESLAKRLVAVPKKDIDEQREANA